MKNERYAFIIMIAITIVGFSAGAFYYFKISRTDFSYEMISFESCSSFFDAVYIFLLGYYNIVKYMILTFLAGFTLFAPAVATVVLIYRGALLGIAAAYLSVSGSNPLYAAFVFFNLIVVFIYINMSCRSHFFSHTHIRGVTGIKQLVCAPETREYFMSFLFLSGFLLLLQTGWSMISAFIFK